MAYQPTIIAASLDDAELRQSINTLVQYVNQGTQQMVSSFNSAIEGMKSSLMSLSSVRVNLAGAFDSTTSGKRRLSGAAATSYEQDQVGFLRQSIALEKQKREEMRLGSVELQNQNRLITQQTTLLKSQTTSMPLNSVLGMPANSIDEITAKMRALRAVQLDPNDVSSAKRVSAAYVELAEKKKALVGTNKQLISSNSALARSFNYIRNRIIYAFAIGGVMKFTRDLYEVRAQYELLDRSLGILIGDMSKGTEIFNELNQMALKSPFTLMELAGGAKQLTAYNFEANEVVDTTRRLADISAALGVPMERLVYNLGQIRAQTVLNARDARDFANAGLPVIKLLADYYTNLEGHVVSTGEVYDRMKKRMVSYNDVMAVINKTTDEGGKFFDFQAKQASTLKVQLANLTLAYNNMMNEIGAKNQSTLAAPIHGLKTLFQNWSSISRVLKNVALSFGILRAAQMIAIRMNLEIAASAKSAALMMGSFGNAIKAVGTSLKAIATNPWAWIFTGIMAVTDLIGKMRAAREATKELNAELRNRAKESSESNIDFLSSKGNIEARDLAKASKLSAREAERAWESLEEQIRTSSSASDEMLSALYKVEDLNERVKMGFDFLEQVQKAQAAMQELGKRTIKVTSDIGWGGIFGEGLVSDLKDLNKELSGLAGGAGLYDAQGMIKSISDAHDEFREELEVTAKSITKFISEHNITDPWQIKEILERTKVIIREKNPEIKDELATLFDVSLDQRIAALTNDAVDRNSSLWQMFMERLKHNSSSAFQDITNEWVKSDKALSKEQQEAVDANLEYFKNTMPWYYDAIKAMVSDASKLKINIGVTFNTQRLSEFQKEMNDRINNAPKTLDFGTNELLPKQDDNLSSWVDARQKDIKALREENKDYAKDDSEYSNAQIKANEKKIQQNQNLLDLWHQSYEEEKKAKSASAKKDPLGDSMQKNIQYINELRKSYKEYLDLGYDKQTALTEATKHFSRSLENVNAILAKYGIAGLKGEDVAGMDLRDVRDYYQGILQYAQASGKATEALEKEIAKLDDEIMKNTQKTAIDSLKSGLSNLKDEYELALDFEANPEMGDVFAEMMGISKQQLEELPHDFEGVVRKLQEIVEKTPSVGAFDVSKNLNRKNLEKWLEENGIKPDSQLAQQLKAFTEYANKIRQDETKKQVDEWNKLLEKYAEYEYKRNQILQTYEREREIALKKGATKEVLDAIEQRKDRELAGLDFEQFQKTSTWLTATGDLATLTDSALGLLIKRLEEYKKSAKNLDPKQIKQINNALKSLRREQRQGNPFLAIANAKDAAKETWDTYQDEIDKYMVKLKQLNDLEESGIELTAEQESSRNNLIDTIAKLRTEQEKAGKVSVKSLTDGISGMAGAISQASNLLADFFTQLGNSKAAENLKALSETLDKASQGAQIGSSFGKYGALIGGAIGLLTGLFSGWADEWSGNADITKKVKESEKQLRRLEEAYKDVEFAAEQAYGVETLGAEESLAAQKKLQLEELQRQLVLEESRKEKYKDEEKIEDLKSKIHDLQLEISRSTKEIVQDLLGISSYGDAITQLVQVMIDAFRNGEDAMAAFGEKWDEMIDNMILKLVVSTFMQKEWDEIMKTLEKKKDEFLAQSTKDYESANTELGIISKMTDDDIAKRIAEQLGYTKHVFNNRSSANEILERGYLATSTVGFNNMTASTAFIVEAWQQVTDEEIQAYRRMLEQQIANAENAGEGAEAAYTRWAIDYLGENGEGRKRMEERARLLEESLGNWYTFGKNANEKALSNLQQGIQGITEDTASALEAYMNSVSQQVYLHSDLLTQIRDTMIGWDFDVQTGVQAEMLLQLQNSYQVQMTIQGILQGWNNANGMAVRVEMV